MEALLRPRAKVLGLAAAVLAEMGVEYEVKVISAHHTPERAREYAQNAESQGIDVLIAMAMMKAMPPIIGMRNCSGILKYALIMSDCRPSSIDLAVRYRCTWL